MAGCVSPTDGFLSVLNCWELTAFGVHRAE